MKKLLIVLVASLPIFAGEINLVDYDDSFKNQVIAIAFQHQNKFFGGSSVVRKGFISQEMFDLENKKGFDELLRQQHHVVTKLLMSQKKVIGFVVFFKAREQSLESLRKIMEAQGLPFNEEFFRMHMPNLPLLEAEAAEFIKLEAIAVSDDFQRQGFGSKLLHIVEEEAHQRWPLVRKVILDTNVDNDAARSLYEKHGYIVCPIQPQHCQLLEIVEYEKEI